RRERGRGVIPVETAPGPDALAALAADRVAAQATQAVRERGRFTLAVSGGSTPVRMFDALAERKLPWEAVHVFQVDERVGPDGHPDRNYTDLAVHLLDRVPIPPGNVHPMPVTADDLEEAARAYAADLAEVTGDGVLDLVHLGLGGDGH